ncbi:SeqA protein, negative modulator of initiation of replication [Cronobacter dublinensis 1210]|uniref:Negative modulator of initiation of replication n=2 Tax=Cronobacter dublinensis TaxID=413497 RepID=A0ABM9QAE0_9ENTR|nr:SeqA protein, negative modulator of initiation of replication [Cronobacter dublinensis 1210]
MLTILPPGCKVPVNSDFCGLPGLTLSAVGFLYNPNDLYSEKKSHWIKMKTIEVDDELYRYIASHTLHIGESASDILRRMLKFSAASHVAATPAKAELPETVAPAAEKPANPARDRVRAMRELLLSDEYAEQKRAVNRFMLVLSTLYSLDADAFADATESLHGRTRVYFAGDEQTLLQSGNQTKPRHVPGTPFWVITNTNTGRKCSMIEHIMQTMQFPAELIEKVCGTI